MTEISTSDLLKIVKEKSKSKKKGSVAAKKLLPIVRTIRGLEMFEELGIEIKCPHCKSVHYKKNGSGRMKCLDCGKTFNPTSNTFMDGFDFSLDEWRDIISHFLLNGKIKNLVLNDKELKPHQSWFLKHKIMFCLASIPQPKLTGIVQIDETSFRESQKGKHELVSFYHKKHKRIARRRYQASNTGVWGTEFVTVIAATDNFGNAIAKTVCLGAVTYELLLKEIDDMVITPLCVCSDNNPIYEQWCDARTYKHWIKPSTYERTRRLYGYIEKSNKHPVLTEEEKINNEKILELMFKEKSGPTIHNSGPMTYDAYKLMVRENDLSLNTCNSLHSLLKKKIIHESRNIGSQYLQDFVGSTVYLYNWEKRHKTKYIGLKEQTDEIIKDMIQNGLNTTHQELMDRKLYFENQPSEHENKKQAKKLKEAREIITLGEEAFEGNSEITEIFDKRKCFKAMKVHRINQLCKIFGIPSGQKLSLTKKIEALSKLPNANEIIFYEIYLTHYASDEVIDYARDVQYLDKPKQKKRGRPRKTDAIKIPNPVQINIPTNEDLFTYQEDEIDEDYIILDEVDEMNPND